MADNEVSFWRGFIPSRDDHLVAMPPKCVRENVHARHKAADQPAFQDDGFGVGLKGDEKESSDQREPFHFGAFSRSQPMNFFSFGADFTTGGADGRLHGS